MFRPTIKYPLLIAALSSSLVLAPSPVVAELTVSTTLNKSITTADEGDIIITPTGLVNATTGAAVTINSGDTLNIESNSQGSLSQAVVRTGGSVNAVQVTEDGAGGKIFVGANRGILGQNNNAAGIEISLNGGLEFTVDNEGSIGTSGANGFPQGIEVNNSGQVVINNESTGTIFGSDDAFRIQSGSNVTINNAEGGVIEQKGLTVINTAAIEFNQNSVGVVNNSGTISHPNTQFESGAFAVFVGNPSVTVNNTSTGLITSQSSAFRYRLNTNNPTFNVNNDGTIFADDHAFLFQNSGQIGLTNNGTITSNAALIRVQNGQMSGSINNNVSGVMTSRDFRILNLESGSFVGNIFNNGTMTTMDATNGSIFRMAGNMVGTVVNNGTFNAGSNGVRIIGNMTGDILNTGTINAATAVFFDGGSQTGQVTNTGTINATSSALLMSGASSTTGAFTNSGSITSDANPAIQLTGNSFITGGIINSGNITGTGGIAIDLTGAVGTSITQNGGTITGDILGMPTATTLNINGGTIAGNITFQGGNDLVNFEGGTFTGTMDGGAGIDILNVNNSFTTSGPITNFENFNVNNAGTVFTILEPISNIGGDIIVNAGTSMVVAGSMTGTSLGDWVNDGSVTVQDSAQINLPALDFQNNGVLDIKEQSNIIFDSITGNGGTYAFEITDINQFANITTQAGGINTDVTGETVQVDISGNGFIQTGQRFVFVDNSGDAITGNNANDFTFTQPSSRTIRFDQDFGTASELAAVARRIPFVQVVESENANAVAESLDGLINNPNGLPTDVIQAIGQIDAFDTIEEVSRSLETFGPTVDGGTVEGSFHFHNNSVDTVISRVSHARSLYDVQRTLAAGDTPYFGMGIWAKAFASRLSQQNIGDKPGYTAGSGALIVGADRLLSPYWRVGGAVSYTIGTVDDRSLAGNELDFDSFQFTLYSSYDSKDAWYVDSFFSVGINEYKSTRNIVAGNVVATPTADYNAWQYSARFQAGYKIKYGKYRITPLVRVRTGMLDVDAYTEKGGGGFNLAVESDNALEVALSGGIRLSQVLEYAEAQYVPEFRFIVDYDLLRDRQEATSNFVASGGTFFNTRGVKPDPLTYLVGAGLHTYAREGLIFSVHYDLALKEQFVGHSGHVKVRYEW